MSLGKEIGFIDDPKDVSPVKKQNFVKLNYFKIHLLQLKIDVSYQVTILLHIVLDAKM